MNHTTALQLAFHGLTKQAVPNTNKAIFDAASNFGASAYDAASGFGNWFTGGGKPQGPLFGFPEGQGLAGDRYAQKPAPAAAGTAVAASKPSLPTMPKNTLGGGSPLTLNPAPSAPQTLPSMPASPTPTGTGSTAQATSFKNVAPPEIKLDPNQSSMPPLSRSQMMAAGPVDHGSGSKDITAPSSGVSIAKGNPAQMIPASAPDNSAVTGMKNSPGGAPITANAMKAAPAAPVGGVPPKPAAPVAAPKPAAPAVKPMARPAAPATPPPAQNMRTTSMIPGQGMKRASDMTHTTALQLALTKVAWAPSDVVRPFTEAAHSFKPLSDDQAPVTALLGGAAGAGIGALTGMGRDEKGKTHKLRNAILGLLAGTGLGAAGVGLGRGLINQGVRNKMSPAAQDSRFGRSLADFAGGQIANHATAGDLANMAQGGIPSGKDLNRAIKGH